MTVTVQSPLIIGSLLAIIAEFIALAAWLWRRFRSIEARNVDLVDLANLQGDALREALNEIDRLRRSPESER